MSKTISVDCMGGDGAPFVIVEGVNLALGKSNPDVKFILYGDNSIDSCLKLIDEKFKDRFTVIKTPSVDLKNMKPSLAIRMARDSSMGMAIRAVKDGRADGCVSAGNTGAYMALAKIILKMLPGIERPAIATLIPKRNGDVVMLDLGANADCSYSNLIDFAILGEALASVAFGKDSPKVGLLNIGSEQIKGNLIVQETYKRLKEDNILKNFVGFIEGDEIFKTDLDVVVTDGFSGNIALKVTEGTVKFLIEQVKKSFNTNLFTKLAYLLIRGAFKKNLGFLNPSNHNGAMLIGLNGVVVKSHGGTDAIGFSNAILSAIGVIEREFLKKVSDKIESRNY